MKIFIYTQDNGLMAIGTPFYQEGMSEQEKDIFLIDAIEKAVPKKSDGSIRKSFIKEQSDLLVANYLTDAWLINEEDGSIYFDRSKGIELKKKQFRFLRKPLLEKLDVDFMKALEIADSTAISEIVAKKQVLRDITNIDMSHCDTPEKLYNYIPEELKTV
jgi:hypothetical protein